MSTPNNKVEEQGMDPYQLGLNESMEMSVQGLTVVVLRVPHGWIYTAANARGLTSVFVPFTNSVGEQ